jgi:hypothetical protein
VHSARGLSAIECTVSSAASSSSDGGSWGEHGLAGAGKCRSAATHRCRERMTGCPSSRFNWSTSYVPAGRDMLKPLCEHRSCGF